MGWTLRMTIRKLAMLLASDTIYTQLINFVFNNLVGIV